MVKRAHRSLTLYSGFSLIELMVVVAVLSILATIGLPLAELAQKRTKEEELRQSLREIRSAIDAYKKGVDQGRIARIVGASGYPPDLGALVHGVTDAQSPRGERIYFLRRLPRDPFATIEGQAASTWGLRSYESSADDPKPGRDVFDVFSKSEEVGLNGQPYKKW